MKIQESKAEKGKLLFLVSPDVEYLTLPVVNIEDEKYLLTYITNKFNLPDDGEITAALTFMRTIVTKPATFPLKKICGIVYKLVRLPIINKSELSGSINDISLCVAYDEGVYNFIIGSLVFP